MRKLFSPCTALLAFVLLFAFGVASASAQSYSWDNPVPITGGGNVAILVDPVTETPYGISAANSIAALTLGAALTAEQAGLIPPSLIVAPPPANAFAFDQQGILYSISDYAVASGATPALLDAQPKVPITTVTGTTCSGEYKDIAIGKGGKVYVLYEADGAQYLLVGYPPALTAGVVVKISPSVLNLASKGNWVTAAITPPEGYDASDIDPASVRITGIQYNDTPIEMAGPISIASGAPHDVSSGKLIVKFLRYDKNNQSNPQSLHGVLSSAFPSGAEKATYTVSLTIEGQMLSTGQFFSGTGNLTVQSPKLPKVKPTKKK